jgi:hypothetical protein
MSGKTKGKGFPWRVTDSISTVRLNHGIPMNVVKFMLFRPYFAFFLRNQSDDLKSEALIVEALIMGSAAGKAGNSPLG